MNGTTPVEFAGGVLNITDAGTIGVVTPVEPVRARWKPPTAPHSMVYRIDALTPEQCRDLISHIAELRRRAAALQRILDIGHDDDCLLCGLKDRFACEALGHDPAMYANGASKGPP